MAVLSTNTCPPPGPLVLDKKNALATKLLWAIPVTCPSFAVDRVNEIALQPYSSLGEKQTSRYGNGIYFTSYTQILHSNYDGPKVPESGTVLCVGEQTNWGSTTNSTVICTMATGSAGLGFQFEVYPSTNKIGLTPLGVVDNPGSLASMRESGVVIWRYKKSTQTENFTSRGEYDSYGLPTNKVYSTGICLGTVWRSGAPSGTIRHKINLVYVWDRQLTDGECWDLVYDPWILFRPHREVVAFSLSATAIATIFRRSNTLQNRIGTRMPV